MGMFDWVKLDKIEFPFDEKYNIKFRDNGLYQTKNFDNNLDTIIFKSDGTIERERHILENTPEEECPYYVKPEWDTSLGKFIGCMRTKEVVFDKLGLPERDTYHFYHSISKYSWKECEEMGMEYGGPMWWIDVWADIENHIVTQFRYKITYNDFLDREEFERREVIEEEGIVLLTSEMK